MKLTVAVLLSFAGLCKAEWVEARVYAYCPCRRCTDGDGVTASGEKFRAGRSLAAPASVPFGTRVFIPSVGWRTADDRMAKRHRNKQHYDVGMATHSEAKRAGVRTERIWVAR